MKQDDREYLNHPLQPLAMDDHDVLRFKPNKIVEYLFETKKLDLNEVMCMPFPDSDKMQIAQLLGYSLSGYGSLSYVTDESYDAAHEMYYGKGK